MAGSRPEGEKKVEQSKTTGTHSNNRMPCASRLDLWPIHIVDYLFLSLWETQNSIPMSVEVATTTTETTTTSSDYSNNDNPALGSLNEPDDMPPKEEDRGAIDYTHLESVEKILTRTTEDHKFKMQDEDLSQLRKLAGNEACIDCGAPDPIWASVNLGIFVCLSCSGKHRWVRSRLIRDVFFLPPSAVSSQP